MVRIFLFYFSIFLAACSDSNLNTTYSYDEGIKHEIHGPCGNRLAYKDFELTLEKHNIPYRFDESERGSFICWSKEHSKKVELLAERLYGEWPSPFNFSFGTVEENDNFQHLLIEHGVKHTRRFFFDTEILIWDEEDDDKVLHLIKESYGFDLNEYRYQSRP